MAEFIPMLILVPSFLPVTSSQPVMIRFDVCKVDNAVAAGTYT